MDIKLICQKHHVVIPMINGYSYEHVVFLKAISSFSQLSGS